MRIHRLKWAGLRPEAHQKTILIDPVEDHLHGDHYDSALIGRCLRPDGLVFCLDVLADTLRRDGLDRVVGFGLNQTLKLHGP